ncbi:MAG: membrane protein insertase YidC [Oscillospiraceae bacterium]|nr:membrane protein insertase YidC [Oscillospiraceae bacterium]
MGAILDLIIAQPLGILMKLCLGLSANYGLSIILFTFFVRLVFLPLGFWVHKNSIKQIRLRPMLNRLEAEYIYDRDKFAEEQMKLYKREKYNLFAGSVPLLLQIPLIIGLISVIYNPLTHLLGMDKGMVEAFVTVTEEIAGEDIGIAPQLKTVELLKDDANIPHYMTIIEQHPEDGIMGGAELVRSNIYQIKALDTNFFGLNLAQTASVFTFSALWLIPFFAGISAFMLCVLQNRNNVLQKEQGFWGLWGMTAFLTAFSLYFGFAVPAGVGLYWIVGNTLNIAQMFMLNAVYSPGRFIDYDDLEESKALLQKAKKGVPKKRAVLFDQSPQGKRERADYKRFFATPSEDMKLVFYSEGGGYYKYFKNIIEVILKNSGLSVHYITSDPEDPVFQICDPQFKPYYIGEARLISLMMKITADMVVMTMPDLQTFHIKRSLVRKDVEYVYVDHGGLSLNIVFRPGAFDYFDTIFAVSELQGREIRAMEKLRGTKKKGILKCGYAQIDSMIAAYESKAKKNENPIPVLLIAPSWSEDNILDSCLDPMLNKILDKGWRIIIRPHPMYIKRFPDKMNRIISKYQDRTNEVFTIETDFSSNATVYSADLMITDWSAIAAEFSFTTLKPTLFVNTKMKVLNPDYDKIEIEPYIITVRDIVGISIEKEAVSQIDGVVEDLLRRKDEFAQAIKAERESYYYNLGCSGKVGARYIIEKLGGGNLN